MFLERKTDCPLCKSSKITHKYHIDRYELKFDAEICKDCGFIFMNPQFKDDVLKKFYSEDYFRGRADYSYVDERDIKKYAAYVWDKRIKFIHKYIDRGNFLDVGCSFGGLLESAAKFYTPFGIEISDYAFSQISERFNKNIHHGTLYDQKFGSSFFSVITMIELIEHLPDPVYAISQCFDLLHKKGVLVIQTANMNGKQARDLGKNYDYFMPGHLSYFTAENLASLLKRTGFEKVKIYYPVEFGLLPKLLKSRGSFKNILDYKSWLRIIYYHMKSKIRFGNFAMTSSMVIYAVK
ncbi:MAG: class I SAM-dependent methyltransferase [Leptospirales bacterium]|nr:class I SAM-dependent methyltransferase [Leptospirales bacterium]